MNGADNYHEWEDTRLGLAYSSYRGIVHYYTNAPFWVDGIFYQANNGGPACVRTMIQLLDDSGGSAELRPSSPPTESELDHYVNTGIFDGWRMS